MKLMELYHDTIMGATHGLDRIRFRGTLRWLANPRGLSRFMSQTQILLKDFGDWVEGLTARIRQSCESRADAAGIEKRYLRSSGVNKELLARQIAAEHGITDGSICLLSVVEPCIAPMVKGNRASKKLELVMAPRKCVFLYHYFDAPQVGFGHVRIQTWAPFNIFICLNGRHWLERQLQQAGIGYRKDGNCFPWIEDLDAAQALLDEQLRTDWPSLLNRLTFDSCPVLAEVLGPLRPEYYWSADETEWATDILFESTAALDRLYPSLLHHAMRVSDSPSVMRYFGRRETRGRIPDELISDYRRRYEGLRVKHWKNHNSVKRYNKSGSILRIETTINNTRDFKVYRHPDDDPGRPASWQKMRKGVSDLHRRCQISDQCNERYGDALASARVEETLKDVVSTACNRTTKAGKRYRGLNPWQTQDYTLLTFLAKGENALGGFRNKDLRHWLYPEVETLEKHDQRKYTSRTTRLIKLLRVHGLIKKVARENRYMLTARGQTFASALMAASAVDIKELTEIAA
ncbi:MAG: hypothetical protein OEV87_12120 [Phycisphaerae bacterium]|nr:hypothetical protein [Phycisphaerae bacterium]